ncbi:MAG: segregation/condensation protein A [Acidobacteriaceae bacterium]
MAEDRAVLPATQPQIRGEENDSQFAVSVSDVYDGPLDLLLDLIRKQKIDIYDIPIAQITGQFLQYVERMQNMDVDVAAEFIYMASTLIVLKSRMLLPRDPDRARAEDGSDEDPRDELVRRLLEHERFKSAAQMLLQKQQLEEAVVTNPAVRLFRSEAATERELAADSVDLARAFQDILERMRSRPVIEVNEESVSVAQMIDYVRRRLLLEDKPVRLKRLLAPMQSRNALICTFLALLELVRLQAILLRQDTVYSDIILKKHPLFDTVFDTEGGVQDDYR